MISLDPSNNEKFSKNYSGDKNSIAPPPPHNKVKFFGHGFRKREKREQDDERKEQKKSIPELT